MDVEQDQDWARLRTAIGEFIMRFTLIESVAIPGLFRVLSSDGVMIEYCLELLTLEQETMLIRRLCDHYQAPDEVKHELKDVLKQLRPLQDSRNEIAHNSPIKTAVEKRRPLVSTGPTGSVPCRRRRWIRSKIWSSGWSPAFTPRAK